MTLSPAQLGFVRALGIILLTTVLGFLSNAANLQGVLPDAAIVLVVAAASSIEHFVAAKGNGALFGAVNR